MEKGIPLQVEAKANEGNRPWAWIGEFNTIPDSTEPAAAQHQGQPGHMEWYQAHRSAVEHAEGSVKKCQHTHDRLSDRKVIKEVAVTWNQPISPYCLQRQRKWIAPQDIPQLSGANKSSAAETSAYICNLWLACRPFCITIPLACNPSTTLGLDSQKYAARFTALLWFLEIVN